MTLINNFWEGEYSPHLPDVDYEDILIESGALASSPAPDFLHTEPSTNRAPSREIAREHDGLMQGRKPTTK